MKQRITFRLQLLALLCVSAVLLTGCETTESRTGGKVLRDIPREERVALMVLNFKNTTLRTKAEEYKPWEVGIPSMIMTDLESIGVFNILRWDRLKDILEQQAFQSYGIVDEQEAVEIGKVVAARFILSGSFMIMNGNLQIESSVFSVEKGTLLGASSTTGNIDDFFKLEKKLVIEMTSYLGAVLTSDEAAELSENIETESVDASLYNYAGEIALMQADELKAKGDPVKAKELIQMAKQRFEDALKHDATYMRAKKNLASLTMAVPMTL